MKELFPSLSWQIRGIWTDGQKIYHLLLNSWKKLIQKRETSYTVSPSARFDSKCQFWVRGWLFLLNTLSFSPWAPAIKNTMSLNLPSLKLTHMSCVCMLLVNGGEVLGFCWSRGGPICPALSYFLFIWVCGLVIGVETSVVKHRQNTNSLSLCPAYPDNLYVMMVLLGVGGSNLGSAYLKENLRQKFWFFFLNNVNKTHHCGFK